ncbi:MFS transporter [Gemmata sp.]|uniref:MFS transporter n=1 Tax=Gemmata sp. TaxID=1914242 RepID=UPI003F6FE295
MRYTLLAFLCGITVIAYVQRTAMNGPSKVIEAELRLTPEDLGLVMGAWYLGYAIFQLPSGWVADRLGSKPALILFALLWSAFTALATLSSGLAELLVAWFLMGSAQAGIFPCCTKAIGATFPRTQQALASGMLACFMNLGAAIGPKVTAELLGPLTWQQIFLLYAAPGLAWAVVFALAVPRPDGPAPAAPVDAPSPAAAIDWTRLVTDRQMILLFTQQFLRAGAVVFFFTWFARFLQETRGLSAQDAARLAVWPPLAGALGGLFGGVFSDWVLARTGNARLARQGMAFAVLLVCAAVALAAYFVADPNVAVLLISIGSFCGIAGGVSGYAVAISYGGKQVATVFATMNMGGNFGATVFPAVVGWLGKRGRWDEALLLFALMFLLSAVCWAVLNPKGTLFGDTEEGAT